ncbi:MAG: extracellular solute-binding protein [Acidimicrobiaceae bacterium]|nr:extracellular solute-binding protein [Acidimicrobiaceae bacterium]
MRLLTHSRMFRVLAVILAFMLVSAACSSDDDSAPAPATTAAPTPEPEPEEPEGVQTDGGESLEPVTLEVLAEAGDEATLELATAQFTEMYPHVSFNITLRAFDDYMQIAPGILSSDDPPDIAHGNQGYTIDGLLVQGGLILPLDDYAEQYGWVDAFGDGTLDQYRFTEDGTDFGNGVLWGINGVAEFVGVYYNKEKLAALGDLPNTFEEFDALLAAAKDAGEVPIQLGNAEGWPALHVYGMVEAAYRPAAEIRDWVFGEPGATVVTDTERQAAAKFEEWRDNGYFPEGVNGIAYDDSVANFIAGEGVFMIAGNWNTATLDEGMGANAGYFAMPVGPSGIVGGTAALALPWHITTSAEHPDLAAEFINLLVSEEFADDLASVGRVAARSSDTEIEGLLAEVTAGAAAVIADEGVTLYADWATPTMFDTLTSKTQELLGGQIDGEQFLNDVQADWDAANG